MSASPTTSFFDPLPHGDAPPSGFQTLPREGFFPTPTLEQNQEFATAPPYAETQYPSQSSYDNNSWDNLGHGKQALVAIVILLGVVAIVSLSAWYCCGCCGLRARRQKRLEARQREFSPANGAIPLGNVPPRMSAGTRAIAALPRFGPRPDAPPPRYEEVVPPQHQTLAGGVTHVRAEEENVADGIVADGKTPMSEIAFEDVVLDRSNGEGSSRTFEAQHFGLGGDTRGHTNS